MLRNHVTPSPPGAPTHARRALEEEAVVLVATAVLVGTGTVKVPSSPSILLEIQAFHILSLDPITM